MRIGQAPLRFYAGMPLLSPDGYPLGVLCVMDVKPRQLTAQQRAGLKVLARQTQHLFELRRYALEQRRLLSEREAFTQRLEHARAELEQRHEKLQQSAGRDQLTGLLNRTALAQLRESPKAMQKLESAAYSLALLDVDHFKQVNDRHGHLLGDRALRAVADAVRASVREGDIAVRYGGEEFLIVLPGTGLSGAYEVAHRVRERVAAASLPFALTVSVGIAAGDPLRDRPEQVFDRADQALYQAKANGRDRVVVDETLHTATERQRLAADRCGASSTGSCRRLPAEDQGQRFGAARAASSRIGTTQKRCPSGLSITHQRLTNLTGLAPSASSRATSASRSSVSMSRCTREGCATFCTSTCRPPGASPNSAYWPVPPESGSTTGTPSAALQKVAAESRSSVWQSMMNPARRLRWAMAASPAMTL